MGPGAAVAPRGHEIECRLVVFARSVGDDRFKGAQGLSSRFASECRSITRSYRQDLSGQYDRGWSSPQDVIQVPRTHDRNQGSCTLTARTQDSPGGGLHSQRSIGRCAIASEGARHVVLAAVHATRDLVPGRGDPEHAGVHGPVCLQSKLSRSKIRNASSLSSHRSFQRLAPRLVAGVHVVAQPALTSLDTSFGKSSSVKVKRYPNLPLLAPPALVSRSVAAFNCPLHPATTASLRPTVPSGHRRAFRQSRSATPAVVFDCE